MGFVLSKVRPAKEETYDLLKVDEFNGNSINSVVVNDDQSVLATGSDDGAIKIWSLFSGKSFECLATLEGHSSYINCLVFEDIFLVSGSNDKSIKKWNITDFQCETTFTGHRSVVNKLLVFEESLYSSSYDRTVRRWDFTTGACVMIYKAHTLGVYPMAFIPRDDEEEEDEEFNGFDDDYGKKHEVVEKDCEEGKTEKEDDSQSETKVEDEDLPVETPPTKHLAPKADLLVSASSDHLAIVWHVKSGKVVFKLEGHTDGITSMVLDDSATNVFTASMDKSIRGWDVRSGQLIRIFEGHLAAVICLSIKGKMMYSGSSDKTGKLWIIEFGDNTRTYQGHEHTVTCIKFHQGFVFTGCGDGIVRCFDAKAGTLKRTLPGHTSAINAFALIGDRLYSASNDGTLRIWDISGIDDEISFAFKEKKKKKKNPAKLDKKNKIISETNHAKPAISRKIIIQNDF